LKVGANASYSHFVQNYLGDDGESGSSGNAFSLINLAPIYPVYIRDANGNFIYDENSRQIFYDYGDRAINGQYRPYLSQSNPLSANALDTREREGNNFTATGTVEVRLPFGFTFTSINTAYLREYRYTNTTNPFFGQYKSSKGIVTKEHIRNWSYNFQQRVNWHKVFGDHDIEVMLGHEYYRLHSYDLWASKNNMFSQENKELAGAVVLTSGSSDAAEYNTESWMGRAQYNYAQRYFASFSLMREASSHFSKSDGKWWGTFWSIGGGWLINKEKFFHANWVDELKLKASYGENGNDLIGSYRFTTTYDIANSNDNVSLVPRSLGNSDISWEKNGKFNIGVDFSLFKGRLTGGIEYYNNTTKDMLTWFPLPASFGFTGYYANVGNMKNNGVEIDLHGDIIRSKDLTWSAYANITSNHNEITSLPDARKTWYDEIQGYGYSSGSYFYQEGASRYTYYTKRYAGVYNEQNYMQTGDEVFDASKAGLALYYRNTYEMTGTGKFDEDGTELQTAVYYDKNGNKIDNPDTYVGEKHRNKVGEELTTVYSEADNYTVGNVLPKAYGGFGTSVEWNGIDFSIDFQYQLGGKVYDSAYAGMMALTNNRGSALHVDMLNAYSASNTGSSIPRLVYGDSYAASTSDRFLTSASYLSLQNITLGYTLPKKWTSKIDLQKVRIYFVADNIWTWSKRQGLDPRRYITGDSGNGYYSSIRTISGGITVTF
jgi:TonB-linked SusC/RagA family outer membrane protein